jgi:cell division protein FtsQ
MDYSEAARRKRGPRKKKHYLLKTLIVLAVLYGLYRLVTSSIFDIKTVEVSGGAHFTSAQITELSGVEKGTNIFRTRTGALKANLESDPYIRIADVKRELPDSIVITVEERSEGMLIQTAQEDGAYAVIDFDGMILRLCAKDDLPQLPIVDGLTPIDPAPGAALKVEQADLLKPSIDFFQTVEAQGFFFKRLDLGGVVTKAYVYDRLICEGDLKNIENNIPAIEKVVYDLSTKGIERGTISVSGSGTCSFTPEIGAQTPDVEAPKEDADAEGEDGESTEEGADGETAEETADGETGGANVA